MRIDQFISGEVVDRLGDVLLLVGLDGSILDANHVALHCYGYSHAEMLSLSIRDIRAPQDQDRIDDQLREAAERGVLFEAEHRRSDGTLFPVEVRSDPVSVDDETALFSIVRDITERKQAEEALRESEHFTASILDTSPNLVYIYDLVEHLNVYANREVSQFLGYTPEQIKGFGSALFEHILHSDDAARVARHHARFDGAGDGDAFDIEYRMRHSNGQWRWLRSRDTVFARDQQGRVTQILGSTEDITERKQAEEALRESKELYRSILNASPDGITRTDLEGRMLGISPAALMIFGYEREEELLGHSVTDFIAPEDRGRAASTIAFMSQDTMPRPGAYRALRAGGNTFDIEVTGGFIRDAEGQPADLVFIVRDITERKQAEEALRESERRFRTMFDLLPEGVAVIDADGVIALANPALERIVGISQERLRQGVGASRTYIRGDGTPMPREEFPSFITKREGRAVYGVETGIVKEDGSVLWVSVSASPVALADWSAIVVTTDITERKQVEQELSRAERIFRATFEHADVGIAHVGTDGTWLRVNQRLCDMLGYTRAELLHITFFDITHPDYVDENVKQLRMLLAGDKETYEAEKRYLRKDGSVVWANLNVALIRDEDGAPDYFVSVLTDITERKRMEVDLQQAGRTAERYLDVAAEVIISLDAQGNVALLNESGHMLLGYAPGELIGKNWIDTCLPEEMRTEVRGVFAKLMAGEGADVLTYENPVITRNGNRLDLLWHNTLLRDTDGCIVGLLSSAQDITERKQADEELRESERRFRTVFDLLPEGVAALDADGVIVFANPALERMLGISQERLRQGASASRTYIRGDGTPMPREEFPSFITKREGRAVYGVETGIVKEDGSVLWVSVSASPVALTDWRAIVVTTDITERKVADEELAAYRQSLEALVEARTADLEEANRQLREATTAKSEFLTSMSHELRTPLNSVIGFSGILSQGLAGPLTDEQHTQLGMINASGRHLLSLVDDILDLAKIEAGRAEVHVEPVDVAALVQAVAGAIGPLAQEEGLELRAETDGCSTTLHSDSGKIRQILFNLIGNAVKFTEHGSVVVTVQDEPDGAFSFAVSDTGHGIAQQDMTRIFAAFTQVPVSASGKPKGTGLGLRISREYAHMLGGEITVRSEVGVGSTFTLTLPAEPPKTGLGS